MSECWSLTREPVTVTEVQSDRIMLLRKEKHQDQAEAKQEMGQNQHLPHPKPTTEKIRNRKHSLKMKVSFL